MKQKKKSTCTVFKFCTYLFLLCKYFILIDKIYNFNFFSSLLSFSFFFFLLSIIYLNVHTYIYSNWFIYFVVFFNFMTQRELIYLFYLKNSFFYWNLNINISIMIKLIENTLNVYRINWRKNLRKEINVPKTLKLK